MSVTICSKVHYQVKAAPDVFVLAIRKLSKCNKINKIIIYIIIFKDIPSKTFSVLQNEATVAR